VIKAGFMVMIQKQSNNHHSGRAHNHQAQKKKPVAGLEFNRELAHSFFFFDMKGIVHHEFVPPNTMVNSDFYYDVLRQLRERATKTTRTFAQPQLAPS
jgi:hypothetical protein